MSTLPTSVTEEQFNAHILPVRPKNFTDTPIPCGVGQLIQPGFPLSNPLVVMMETIQNRHTDDLTTRIFRQANFT